MITPKIPLLKDGQILSVDVVNSIIKRTEYAGDLLKQSKLIAGDGVTIQPQYDGTRVTLASFLSGSRIVGYYTRTEEPGAGRFAFVYDGVRFSNILPEISTIISVEIDGANIIVGYNAIDSSRVNFLFDGNTFTLLPVPPDAAFLDISGSRYVGIIGSLNVPGFVGDGFTFSYINTSSIVPSGYRSIAVFPYGIDGQKIVGATFIFRSIGNIQAFIGWVYDGSNYLRIEVPGFPLTNLSGTSVYGVDGENIIGESTTNLNDIAAQKSWLYNGETFTYISFPGSSYTRLASIKGSNIVGTYGLANGVERSFIFNGSTYSDFIYPGAVRTVITGIG